MLAVDFHDAGRLERTERSAAHPHASRRRLTVRRRSLGRRRRGRTPPSVVAWSAIKTMKNITKSYAAILIVATTAAGVRNNRLAAAVVATANVTAANIAASAAGVRSAAAHVAIDAIASAAITIDKPAPRSPFAFAANRADRRAMQSGRPRFDLGADRQPVENSP